MRFCAADRGRMRFSLVVGDTAVLSGVKYVITLDTDTQLPRDAARQFVGAMAHPLNRPRYDEDKQRVVRGIRHPAAARGRRACQAPTGRGMRACAAASRASIRIRAPSPMFTRTCFGEGSFIGKGIYDVDAFERALGGTLSRKPDPQPRSAGRVLRARRAVERRAAVRGISVALQRRREPPAPLDSRRLADCAVAAAARSRPRRPRCEKNPLSALSRWKIFDNLRRSLVPAALTLLLLLGWTILPRPGSGPWR